jgi:hypothetical protein
MEKPMPVEYMLEVYMPGEMHTVAFTKTAQAPFQPFAVGDLIDCRNWDVGLPGRILRVTQIVHYVWEGGGRIAHKVGVLTRDEELAPKAFGL